MRLQADPNSTPPTILAVDDDPANLGVLTDYFKKMGFRVNVARDGHSALEKARYGRPDLILLDVLMSGIDGFETCRLFKADESLSGIPVILMTALIDTEDKVKGFQSGAVDYITKPFQFEEVLARIQIHLTLDRMRKQLAEQNKRLLEEEEALRRSEEKYRDLIENLNDVIFSLNPQGCFTYISPAIERYARYSVQDVLGQPFSRFVHPEDLPELQNQFMKTLNGVLGFHEFRIVTKDGRMLYVRTSSRPLWEGDRLLGLTGVMIDITQSKEAETALRNSKERYRLLLDVSPDPISVYDHQGKIIYLNPAFEQTFGWTLEELIGQGIDFVPSHEAERTREAVQRTLEGEKILLETQRLTKDGRLLDIQLKTSIFTDPEGHLAGDIVIYRDISERKQAEEELARYREHLEELVEKRTAELARVNRMLKILSECNQAMVRAKEEDVLLQDICRIIVDMGGYPLVWVGMAEEDEDKTVRPVAQAGWEEGYLKRINISWADTERGRGPTGTAIRTGKPCIAHDIQSDPHFAPWREEALRRGYASSIALPLQSENRVLGALNIYAAETAAFPAPELELLTELANDLAYGLSSLRATEERRKAEEALKQSETRYRLLAENSSDVIWTMDMSLKYTYVSPSVFRLRGFRPEEARQKTIEEDLTPISLAVALKAFQEEMEEENREEKDLSRSRALELELTCKDGATLWTEVRMTFLRDSVGRPIGILGVTRDISERKRAEEALKESEERYRVAIQSSNDGIALVKGDRHIFVNQKFLKIFGYDQTEEIVGKPISQLVHPDDQRKVLEFNRRRQRGEEVPSRYEFKGMRKDGKQVFIEVSAAQTTYRGELVSLVFLRDITERKRLESQLQQAQKMEAIGTLAGGIAHDFNNILSVIIGCTELSLLSTPVESSVHGFLRQLLEAGHRATDLVQQILIFSRKKEIERIPLQLGLVIKEVLKMMRSSLPSTIQINHYIESGAGSVLADPTQIHQLLMNLCTNGAHAMRIEGGILTVRLANVDIDLENQGLIPEIEPGAYLLLTVSDTGQGMDSLILDRIFEPYFTTKAPGEGTGLGLAVVHGIVKSYGGAIQVQSEPGHGSTFQIYLPRIEQATMPEIADSFMDSLPGGRECLLLVDDEEALLRMAKQMLEHLGYEVITSRDSLEALNLFRNRPDRFDLVITDMTMPKMTGDRLALEILQIRPSIPIILCSGFTERISRTEAQALGIREFLQKPLNLQTLAKTVREMLLTISKDDLPKSRHPGENRGPGIL